MKTLVAKQLIKFWRNNGVLTIADDNATIEHKIVSAVEKMILEKSTRKEGILELITEAKNDDRRISVCS